MLPTENLDHPKALICPISLAIFKEPVTIAPSGLVYEWEEIEKWIADAKAHGKPALCPQTNMPITGYVKAFNMLAVVEDYLKLHPDAVKDQYEKSKKEILPNTPVRINHDETAPVRHLGLVPQDPSADDRIAIEAAQAALNAAPRRDISRQVRDMAARSAALHNVDGDYSPRAMVHRLLNNNVDAQEELRHYELFQGIPDAVRASGATQPLIGGLRNTEAAEPGTTAYLLEAVTGSLGHDEFARRMLENQRIRHDAEAAERRQAEEVVQHDLDMQRENERNAQLRRESEALARQRLERERELARAQENHDVELPGEDGLMRDRLILKIQDLIFALDFELGPSFGLRLEWKKIQVKDGPKDVVAMYHVLKAAIRALNELNPDVLNAEREKYKGQYDCVNTMFGGKKSLGDGGYANFALKMGTTNNQPGYLIYQMLTQVDNLLNKLSLNHPDQVQHMRVVRP